MNIVTYNKLFLFKIAIFFFLTFIFWLKGVIFLDPDFGWHIRYGQIILSQGIPNADPFSYTMPSYTYADHEWLLDVVFALIYPVGGFILLSLFFAVITTLAIFLSVKLTKVWHLSIVFLASSILLSFTGIRPQIISWLLFVVVLKIVQSKRYFYLLPVIFFFWANLHAGFIMGLLTLLIYISCQFVSKRKLLLSEIYVVVLSALATLINPYQFKLWQEIWVITSDPLLRRAVEEWFPILFAPHPLIILWLFIFLFLFLRYRSKLSLFEKIFYVAMTLAGLSGMRNAPFFILATLPSLTIFSTQYITESKKFPAILYEKIHISIFLLFLFVYLLVVSQIFNKSYMEARKFPADAVSFLKKHDFEGEVFAPYNWGGYLIWQYPQRKVFIDGRMPSWRQEEKKGESADALDEYFKVFSKESELEKIFNKYQIKLVLWPNQSGEKITFAKKLLNRWQSIFIIKYSDKEFIKTLENSGWKKIYSDDLAVIYQR